MIKFGTSGWRGVIGEDFTFEHVRVASQGIANYLLKENVPGNGVVVGYDTRFLSEKFAFEAAKILAYNGIQAWLCDRDVPTPCISFETRRRRAKGAINFTASHNPPEYNGLKFSTANGAPALPEVTRRIEAEINALEERHERVDVYEKEELIETIDPKERYLEDLRGKFDIDALQRSKIRVAVDALYGTSRDYLDYFLLEAGVDLKIIHNYRDPYFGGFSPECNQKNLGELRRVVMHEKYHLGLATDGDADRFGIIDDRGKFISANTVIALLALYVKRHRNTPGGLARTVATTHLVDQIAKKLDVPLYETPVGFKYIGELILEDKLAMGGEESAGLSIHGHLPEKDGVLACLLMAEMLAVTGKTVSQLTREMFDEFGSFVSRRLDVRLTTQIKSNLQDRLANPPRELAGEPVRKVRTIDGVKLELGHDRWVLFRMSGTEPVARIYAEACTPKDLKNLFDAARKMALG